MTDNKKEIRLSSVQMIIKADIFEDGQKISEVFLGPRDEAGNIQNFEFYNINQLKDFAERLQEFLEAALKQG